MGNDYTQGFLLPFIKSVQEQQAAAAQPGYSSPLSAFLQANLSGNTNPLGSPASVASATQQGQSPSMTSTVPPSPSITKAGA